MNRKQIRALATRKAKMPKFKQLGLFWHYHHKGLLELHDDAEMRLGYIISCKAWQEWEVRVKRLNPVKRIVPRELAVRTKRLRELLAQWHKDQSMQNYNRLDAARERVRQWIRSSKNQKAIERWHKRECKDCPYKNGSLLWEVYN